MKNAAVAFISVAVIIATVSTAGCGSKSTQANSSGKTATVTRQDVVDFVDEAIAYGKKVGKDKAVAEFNNPKGKFVRGELYIYAYTWDGVALANGGNPSLVGQNLIDMTDPNGVKVIQELMKVARAGHLHELLDHLDAVGVRHVDEVLAHQRGVAAVRERDAVPGVRVDVQLSADELAFGIVEFGNSLVFPDFLAICDGLVYEVHYVLPGYRRCFSRGVRLSALGATAGGTYSGDDYSNRDKGNSSVLHRASSKRDVKRRVRSE